MFRGGNGFLRWWLELGSVGPEGEDNAKFRFVSGVLIILREAFADLGGGCADDRIEIGVVIRFAGEDFNAQGAFLEFPRMSVQRALDYIAQQVRVSLAVLEEGVGEYPFQLCLDGGAFDFIFGHCGRQRVRRNGLRDLNTRRKQPLQPRADYITQIIVMIRPEYGRQTPCK